MIAIMPISADAVDWAAPRTYEGHRRADGSTLVLCNARPLDPHLDVPVVGPPRFDWSYDGGAPGRLAFAIIADRLGNDEHATRYALATYQAFKHRIIVGLPHRGWVLSGIDVATELARLNARRV